MNTGDHTGGRDNTCENCSQDGNRKACLFYNKDGTLTRYAFSCGYVEVHGDKNLSMEHGVFHVKGVNAKHQRCWESFDKVKHARAFLRLPFPSYKVMVKEN